MDQRIQRGPRPRRCAIRGIVLAGMLMGLVTGTSTSAGATHSPAPASASGVVRVVRTIPMAPAPDALVVDTAAGHVFVLHRRATAYSSLTSFPTHDQVTMLDARTGTVLRSVTVEGNPLAAVVDERRGHVFVIAGGPESLKVFYGGPGSISMLDAATGALLRTVPLPGAPTALLLAQRSGRVFVTAQANDKGEGPVSVLDSTTGALLRTLPVSTVGSVDRIFPADEHGGRVYLSASVGYDAYGRPNPYHPVVDVLDAASGALVSTIHLGPFAWLTAVDPQAGRLFIEDFTVHVVRLYSAVTGALVATTHAWPANPEEVIADPGSGRVFVSYGVSSQTRGRTAVAALDAASGARLWVTPLPPAGGNAPVLQPGPLPSIVLAPHLRRLLMPAGVVLDTRTGAVVGSVAHLTGALRLAGLDEANGRVYVTDVRYDQVHVVDARSGALLATIPVGHSPYGLAILPRMGLVFVTNLYSATVTLLAPGAGAAAVSVPPVQATPTPSSTDLSAAPTPSGLVGVLTLGAAGDAAPVYASTADGLYRAATPPFTTWTRRNTQRGIVALSPNPAQPDTVVYAALAGRGMGIYRSTDAAQTTTLVTSSLSLRVDVFARDPRTPSTVYAGGYSDAPALYKSTHAGPARGHRERGRRKDEAMIDSSAGPAQRHRVVVGIMLALLCAASVLLAAGRRGEAHQAAKVWRRENVVPEASATGTQAVQAARRTLAPGEACRATRVFGTPSIGVPAIQPRSAARAGGTAFNAADVPATVRGHPWLPRLGWATGVPGVWSIPACETTGLLGGRVNDLPAPTAARSREPTTAARNGVVATIPLPKMAVGVAVDPRRQRVFVEGQENVNDIPTTIYTLAGNSGRLFQHTDTGRQVGWDNPVVDERHGEVLTIDGDGRVAMLDASTGAPRRRISLGAHVFARAVAIDSVTGAVVAAGVDFTADPYQGQGVVSVLDTRRGRVVRTATVGISVPEGLLVEGKTRRIFVAGDTLQGAGRAAGGHVAVLNEETMRLLRTVTIGPGWFYGLASDRRTGHVFVVNSQTPPPVQIVGYHNPPGTVSMLDSRTGALLHRAPVGQVPAAIAVDESTSHVFVVNALSNTVSVLETVHGTVVATASVGAAPRAVGVDTRSGHVFVANSACPPTYHACLFGPDWRASSLSELDSHTGVVRRTRPIAPGPLAIAVDEAAHRAYVASMGDTVSGSSEARGPGMGPLSATAWTPPSGTLTILDTSW